MEITEYEDFCIYAPLSSKLDGHECERLVLELISETRPVAIDLSYVNDCSTEFIVRLKQLVSIKNFGIFNIPSDIFAIFNLMGLDKTFNLYVCEDDCKSSIRQLVNRKFSVI
ncbi:MAG: hypothetical protein MJ237_04030 [bacterium]|nr:hypothetical protein [bacterium]